MKISTFIRDRMPVVRFNPRAREQSLHALGAAVAGPALMYAGYRFPGSTASRAALTALGAFMTYMHYARFRGMMVSQKEIDEAKGKIIQVKNLASQAIPQAQAALQALPQTIEEFPTLTPEEEKLLEDNVLNAPEFSLFDTGTVRGEGAHEDLGFDIRDFAGFFK
jgi:hypothetical protein